jgi:hypothetical protein
MVASKSWVDPAFARLQMMSLVVQAQYLHRALSGKPTLLNLMLDNIKQESDHWVRFLPKMDHPVYVIATPFDPNRERSVDEFPIEFKELVP